MLLPSFPLFFHSNSLPFSCHLFIRQLGSSRGNAVWQQPSVHERSDNSGTTSKESEGWSSPYLTVFSLEIEFEGFLKDYLITFVVSLTFSAGFGQFPSEEKVGILCSYSTWILVKKAMKKPILAALRGTGGGENWEQVGFNRYGGGWRRGHRGMFF